MSRFRMITRSSALFLIVILVTYSLQSAQAIPTGELFYISVDTTEDDPARSTCDGAIDNDCSLRGAISFANASSSGSYIHITIPPGMYAFEVNGPGEDANLTGDLDILGNFVYLEGAGTSLTTINALNMDRVLDNHNGTLTVQHLKITQGQAPTGENGGGGIKSDGGGAHLYLNDVLIEDNTVLGNAMYDAGGGVYTSGLLDIRSSTIHGNTACHGGGIYVYQSWLKADHTLITQNVADDDPSCGDGGGISTRFSTLFELTNVILAENLGGHGGGLRFVSSENGTISDSTIRDNDAVSSQSDDAGGGLFIWGNLTLNRVTISGNQADGYGGGILNESTLTMNNSTISGNSGTHGGGLCNKTSGIMSLDHVTIANNTATTEGYALYVDSTSTNTIHNTILASSNTGSTCHLNAGNVLTDLGYNLSSDSSCGLVSHDAPYHDWIGVPPDLYALADNGGATWTMAINPMSYARDGADPVMTQSKDQRGYYRPVDGDSVPGAISDIGAYEYLSFPLSLFNYMPMILKPMTY
jgi:hypothetical protein